jgi:hypothetical protein
VDRVIPDNAQLETVVRFAPDPRGWGMFTALISRVRREVNGGSRVYIDARGEQFSGWAATTQRFTGLAGLSNGGQRAIASTSSQLVDQRSTGNEGAMRAFYERLGQS